MSVKLDYIQMDDKLKLALPNKLQEPLCAELCWRDQSVFVVVMDLKYGTLLLKLWQKYRAFKMLKS